MHEKLKTIFRKFGFGSNHESSLQHRKVIKTDRIAEGGEVS
jgi:hypothetical protein